MRALSAHILSSPGAPVKQRRKLVRVYLTLPLYQTINVVRSLLAVHSTILFFGSTGLSLFPCASHQLALFSRSQSRSARWLSLGAKLSRDALFGRSLRPAVGIQPFPFLSLVRGQRIPQTSGSSGPSKHWRNLAIMAISSKGQRHRVPCPFARKIHRETFGLLVILNDSPAGRPVTRHSLARYAIPKAFPPKDRRQAVESPCARNERAA